MRTIITITGKSGSGKTTLEEYLKCNLSSKVCSLQMAELLKSVVSVLTGCRTKALDDQDFKKSLSPYIINNHGILKQLTYRELLLHIAGILRFDNDDIFINYVLNKLDYYTETFEDVIVIIPDVREKHELESLQDYAKENNINLISVRVIRPCCINTPYYKHKSETDLDDYKAFDHTIINDKDVNDFIISIDTFIKDAKLKSKFNYVEQELF